MTVARGIDRFDSIVISSWRTGPGEKDRPGPSPRAPGCVRSGRAPRPVGHAVSDSNRRRSGHLSRSAAQRRYAHVTSMDDALAAAAAARPADDFDALFQSQFQRLARLVRRVVTDPAEAEDLATDVLWKCYRKQPAAINLEGWLSRCAIRAALDSIRRKARRARYESFWRPGAPAAKPDDLLQRSEEADRVRAVLARLKPQFATLLVLRSGGSDYRELASALGVRASSIGTLIARAEARFRKEYLERHGDQ